MPDAAPGAIKHPQRGSEPSLRTSDNKKGRRMISPKLMLLSSLFYMAVNSNQPREPHISGPVGDMRMAYKQYKEETNSELSFDQFQEEAGSGMAYKLYKEGTDSRLSFDQFQEETGSGMSSGHQELTPPNMETRRAEKPRRKVHRAVGWVVGTMLTLAAIMVLVATVSMTSRGTMTNQENQEERKGCCCSVLHWLTKTSSQLPLWKSLLLKTMVTILSTIAAALFSLLITNLLAEREESVEATVRDILGISEEEEFGHERRKRETDPGKVHWLAVMFLVWLTTVPLVCYIVLLKCTETAEPAETRTCWSTDTNLGDTESRVGDSRSNKRRRNEEQPTEQETGMYSSASSTSWTSPPSPCSLTPPTPPPTFCTWATPTKPSSPCPTTTATSSATPAWTEIELATQTKSG